MRHTSTHNSELDYTSKKPRFGLPHISLIYDELEIDDIKYDDIDPSDYKYKYFTTEIIDDGTISFNIWRSMGTDMIKSISYSTDDGETWTTTNNTDGKTEHLVIDVNVNEGDEVMWKGITTQMGYYDEEDFDDYVGSFFSSNCEFDAKGNVMSLLYGDDFKGETTIDEAYAFCRLFSDYDEQKTCSVVNAKDLSLPATTLTEGCYGSMFQGCTSLTSAPELPATTLTYGCYSSMFYGCTSLTSAPELPATTLANYCYSSMFNGCMSLTSAPELPAMTLTYGCYSNMFYGCMSLTSAPELPATTLTDYCYSGMFNGCISLTMAPELPATTLTEGCYEYMFYDCTSLTTAPELPATTLAYSCYGYMFRGCTSLTTAPELPVMTLANNCYNYMFSGCTSLTTAPELPATTLAYYCYNYMFSGCTSLTTAPELPATTLAGSCYSNMFRGCTSLTTAPELAATTLAGDCYYYMFNGCTSLTSAPELPAITLANGCYGYMFQGCTRLNYIKAMFTTTPSTTYTNNWVQNVASSGKFVKNNAATWNVTGNHGVPTGWTVQTDYPFNTPYLTFTALEPGTFTFTISQNVTTTDLNFIEYSTDNGETWTKTNNINNQAVTITTPRVTVGSTVMWRGVGNSISTSTSNYSYFSSSGKYNVSGNVNSLTTNNTNTLFYSLFNRCKIVDAKHLILPATTLAQYCYYGMFSRCTLLTSAPELPATALAANCYDSMFNGCTSLTTAPELQATTLAQNCYYGMFKGCTSLITVPELPATTLTASCYYAMFSGCTSLTIAPALPATTLAASCYVFMFNGCTSLTTVPELPATTLAGSCYNSMFRGCTSLTTVPDLPATTLATNCYNNMFNGCTKLKYIKALFTTTPSSSYTLNWVNGVSSTGTFVKNYAATWNVSGDYGIPTGWTVQIDESSFNTPYLTFTALEPGTFTFTINANVTTTDFNFIEYSTDNGETWVRTNNINNQAVTITTPQVTAGSTVMWRGVGSSISKSTSYYSYFSSSGRYNVSGKVNSLTTNSANTLFCYLFKNCKIVDAKHLILPDTALAGSCYYNMFANCTTLTAAPELPATTLANSCYSAMFSGCTSLTAAPELPATALAGYCYQFMFNGCTSLTVASALPATILAQDCYRCMLGRCISLTTAPELPATTLADNCYFQMFSGCASLTTAPELPATTLTKLCYDAMFYGCTSLTTMPELPSTMLDQYCYYQMFYGCTSLTTLSKLPATKLSFMCYSGMFQNCTSLTTAPELPATSFSTHCYYQMFYGCTSLTTAPELPATTLTSNCYYQMFYGCTSLTTAPELPSTRLGQYCYYQMFYGCTSLTTAPELPATTLADSCYQQMFQGCTSLTIAPELPATTLTQYCYYYMFSGCTALTTTPKLPATMLATCCYEGMFSGCTSLIAAPVLPATTLVSNCYVAMFDGCTSLCFIKALFTSIPSDEFTNSWVYNVAPNGTFIGDPLAGWAVIGINAIPNGWVHNMHEKVELMSIWIDDFYKSGNFDESTEEFDGEPIMTVINRAINDTQYHQGANKFTYYGQTLELDNHTYYLWESIHLNDNDDNLDYLLTTSDDYDTLNRQSLMYTEDYTQMFTSLVAFLNSDKTLRYDHDSNTVNVQQLLLVERPKTPIMGAWIDDYAGYVQINAALEDPYGSGCPQYFYTGNTMQYNGETCYIWETEYDEGEPYYILTNTIDYNTLYSQSLDSTRTPVQFTSMTGMLNDDSSVRYEEGDDTFDTTVLVRIDNSSSPMKMWVDDFYTLPDMDLVDELDDNVDSSAANSLNANLYVYYGDTIEYDGNEYYLWKYNEDGDAPDYLLTTSNDYDDLYDASILGGCTDASCPYFFGRLRAENDEGNYIAEPDQQLLKVFNY